MCVAILQKTGKKVDPAKLDEGAYCNGDGAGYSFWDGNKVQIRRALKWKQLRAMYLKEVEQFGDTSPFSIHFRIKSHGAVSKDNCHPFRLTSGASFIHNGIINIPKIPTEQSDTRWFVSQVLDRLPKDWENDVIWVTMVQEMLGSGKAVAIWRGGYYTIFGESRGRWEDEQGSYKSGKDEGDIWYSNNSCSLPSQWEKEKRAAGPKALPAAGQSTWIGGTPSSGNINKPLPHYGRVGGELGSYHPFSLPEGKFEKIGPNRWRQRSLEELIRDGVNEEDQAADEGWEQECLAEAMCPRCLGTFHNTAVARYHFRNCNRSPVA